MRKQYDRPNRPAKQTNKPKMTMTLYSKEFESFSSLVEELKTLHPEFDNIFTYEENSNHPMDAADDILKYFLKNNPNVIERTNLLMAVSVSATRATLKTNKFFTIEWSFKYTREGFITDLVATISTFTKEQNPEELNDMIVKLGEKSWNIVEKPVKNFK